MNVIDQVRADLTAARRARDATRRDALSTLLAALEDARKRSGSLEADTELATLRRERKRRVEAASSFRDAGRVDAAAREDAEAALIDTYLPQMLDPGQVDALVDEAIRDAGATDPRHAGSVIRLVLERGAGRVDGAGAAAAVRRRLSGS